MYFYLTYHVELGATTKDLRVDTLEHLPRV